MDVTKPPMRRTRGIRSSSRSKLRKNVRDKGMPPISRMIQEFDEGEKVTIKIEPSIHKGMPDHRFQGITGVIKGKRGKGYLVAIKDKNKPKLIISLPVHLRRVRN